MTHPHSQRATGAISQKDKAKRVRAAVGRMLYKQVTNRRGPSLPLDPLRCIYQISRIATNLPRQCSRRSRVKIGGLPFCLQHGDKVKELTGLGFDEEQAAG